jgi:hypothetical protein
MSQTDRENAVDLSEALDDGTADRLDQAANATVRKSDDGFSVRHRCYP